MYVLRGALVLGGLLANVMVKERRKTMNQIKSEVNLQGVVDADARPEASPSATGYSLVQTDSSRFRSEGDTSSSSMASTGDHVRAHNRRKISNEVSMAARDRRQDAFGAGAGKIGYNVKRFSPVSGRGMAVEDTRAETESLLGSSRGTGSTGV